MFRWPHRYRSLLAQSALALILPFALVVVGLIVAGLFAYQQILASLLVDRNRQLAELSALRVSEVVDGYANVLAALASNPDLQSGSASIRAAALEAAADVLQVFDAGVAIVDAAGQTLTTTPSTASPAGATVADQAYFETVRRRLEPAFSNVVADARDGRDIVVVAVPLLDDRAVFAGSLLGAFQLEAAPLGEPIARLIVGNRGFAYLVDRNGRIVFHPQPEDNGTDFSDRPFVQRVMRGERGGLLWTSPSGERLVLGYAPVAAAGWGVIVRESWDLAVAPARFYVAALALGAAAAVGVSAYLSWRGARRITTPIRLLAAQTDRLAAGEAVEPIAPSSLVEIDGLAQTFHQMAVQIASYRAGLRRYLGAITHSQEEERRRLARDLHDETAQSLLAISRRLELLQKSEVDPERAAQLASLQTTVADTLRGLRHISQDLRPLMLEDLGLIPALQALVRAAREGEAALPHAQLEVSGQPQALSAEQELTLYRITQETLTNVRKHACATGVRVTLAFGPAQVLLEVRDDGRGLELPAALSEFSQRGSFGLMGIQERVWAAGGTLKIDTTPGRGVRLSVTLPVAPATA